MNNHNIILDIAILYSVLPELRYYEYNDYPNVRIGNGNPYYKCKYCGISDPQINMSNYNHGKNCQWVIAQNKLQLLKAQLTTDELLNLNDIIEEIL